MIVVVIVNDREKTTFNMRNASIIIIISIFSIYSVKSVQIRRFFWPKYGKYGPEKTPYLGTFHTDIIISIIIGNRVTKVFLLLLFSFLLQLLLLPLLIRRNSVSSSVEAIHLYFFGTFCSRNFCLRKSISLFSDSVWSFKLAIYWLP